MAVEISTGFLRIFQVMKVLHTYFSLFKVTSEKNLELVADFVTDRDAHEWAAENPDGLEQGFTVLPLTVTEEVEIKKVSTIARAIAPGSPESLAALQSKGPVSRKGGKNDEK